MILPSQEVVVVKTYTERLVLSSRVVRIVAVTAIGGLSALLAL